MKELTNHFSKLLLLATVLSVTSAMGQISANYLIPGPAVGCGSLAVEFQDISTGNPTSWFWDFGNGLTSTDQNPVMLFSAGVYDVTLIVTDSAVFDTIVYNDIVKVFDNPEANFTADVTSGCLPLEVSFEDLSLSSSPIVSWFWDFGDGGNGNIQNSLYEYENQGAFSVSLLIEDANNCQDIVVISNFISTEEKQNVNFEVFPEFSCNSSQQVNFTASNLDTTSFFKWIFGDGDVSVMNNPMHEYTSSGVYDVSLISGGGICVDTLTKQDLITTGGLLPIDFSVDTSNGCEPFFEAKFVDLSSSYTTDWFWDFGDGTTSNLQHPQHIYINPGEYDVKLKISNQNGCVQNLLKTSFIEVYPEPIAQVAVSQNSSCTAPVLIDFFEGSQGISSWNWEIEDSVVSSSSSFGYMFNEEGIYNVSLELVSSLGCYSLTELNEYIIIDSPEIEIDIDQNQGCTPLSVSFEDHSESIDGIVNWNWGFGDLSFSTQQNPSHTYTQGGTFDVSLTVENSIGCIAQKSFVDFIKTTHAPISDFSFSSNNICGNDTVFFTDLTNNPLVNEWYWDFWGQPYLNSNVQNPAHVYQDTGYFDVSLVTAIGGCYDTLKIDSAIYVQAPIASFYTVQNCDNYNAIKFFNSSVDYDSSYWDFGDGNFSTIKEPEHHFSNLGIYQVTLKVFNAQANCWGELTKTIRVEAPMPALVVDSLTPSAGCPPLTVLFHDVSPYSDENPNATLNVLDKILFGDGNGSHSNYMNTYLDPGYYAVQHIVGSPMGCVDTLTYDSLVYVYEVQANMQPPLVQSCMPFEVELNDMSISQDSIVSWEWELSNGVNATGKSSVFSFQTEGLYDVQLKVKTALGCEDSLFLNDIIEFQIPNADFTNVSAACLQDTLDFISTGAGVSITHQWDISSNSFTQKDVSYAFNQLGIYDVLHIVVDSFGCADTVVKEVNIIKPIANFSTTSLTSNCPPLLTTFLDSSVGALSYQWFFGDSSVSTVQNPSHIYDMSGEYDVTLIVTDLAGCSDTLSEHSLINVQGPYGSFQLSDTEVCSEEPIQFVANTLNTATYYWDFGDGVFAIGDSVSHRYQNLNVFYPILTVENQFGCQFLIESDSITVLQNTVHIDLMSDTIMCLNDTIQLNSNSNANLISWSPTTFLIDSLSMSPSVFPEVTTEYVVSYKDGFCTNKDTIRVVVDQEIPATSFSAPNQFCVFEPKQLTNTSLLLKEADFYWNLGNGNLSEKESPIVSFSQEGVYPVSLEVVYKETGCKFSTLDSVIVHDLPEIALSAEENYCQGDTVVLNASGGILYDFGSGFDYMSQNFKVLENSTYFKVFGRDNNGCVNQDSVYVNSLFAPSLQIFGNTKVCEKDTISLLAVSDGEVYWNNESVNSDTYRFLPKGKEKIRVESVGENECRVLETILVDVHPLPTAEVNITPVQCLGESIFLDAVLDVASINSIVWDVEGMIYENKLHIEVESYVLDSLDVVLTIQDEHACVNSLVFENAVIIREKPVAIIEDYMHDLTDLRAEANFIESSIGATDYLWNFGDNQFSIERNPTHHFDTAGVYNVSLVVKNEFACQDSVSVKVEVSPSYNFWIPNAFTPNGDGLDEVFKAEFFGVEEIELSIYNRWGEVIYMGENSWDGRDIHGMQLSAGVYLYQFVTIDRVGKTRHHRGELNLIL